MNRQGTFYQQFSNTSEHLAANHYPGNIKNIIKYNKNSKIFLNKIYISIYLSVNLNENCPDCQNQAYLHHGKIIKYAFF